MFTYFRLTIGHTSELLDLALSHIANAAGPPEIVETKGSEVLYRVPVAA